MSAQNTLLGKSSDQTKIFLNLPEDTKKKELDNQEKNPNVDNTSKKVKEQIKKLTDAVDKATADAKESKEKEEAAEAKAAKLEKIQASRKVNPTPLYSSEAKNAYSMSMDSIDKKLGKENAQKHEKVAMRQVLDDLKHRANLRRQFQKRNDHVAIGFLNTIELADERIKHYTQNKDEHLTMMRMRAEKRVFLDVLEGKASNEKPKRWWQKQEYYIPELEDKKEEIQKKKDDLERVKRRTASTPAQIAEAEKDLADVNSGFKTFQKEYTSLINLELTTSAETYEKKSVREVPAENYDVQVTEWMKKKMDSEANLEAHMNKADYRTWSEQLNPFSAKSEAVRNAQYHAVQLQKKKIREEGGDFIDKSMGVATYSFRAAPVIVGNTVKTMVNNPAVSMGVMAGTAILAAGGFATGFIPAAVVATAGVTALMQKLGLKKDTPDAMTKMPPLVSGTKSE
ncbi:hypothetical protein COB57_02040 [Candidatus Peregrinibacteria bacterium]|nr:MAG: hypothetical protein COB57_02040 [Candidatus Peregrinibacteria bacterium]